MNNSKCFLNTYKPIIVLLFFSLVPFLNCFGKGGDGHLYDMKRIMPFDENDPVANKKIFDFFKMVNEYLDNADFPSRTIRTGHPAFIKNTPELKYMKFANHRIWFHWGFNKDPKKFQPLTRIIKRNIAEDKLKADHEYIFWKSLMGEISRRNKFLMDEWAKISGYSGLSVLSRRQRRQSNAFITLLVSIHLLGDHTTSEIGVIINRKALYGEINNAIDNLAGKSSIKNRQAANSLKNKLHSVEGDPNKYLDKLSIEFTPFLFSLEGIGYNYKRKFEAQNYKMKAVPNFFQRLFKMAS